MPFLPPNQQRQSTEGTVSALPTRQNVQTKNLIFSLKCCIQLNETSTSRCLMSSILLTCDLYFTLTCDCLNLIISAVHCYVVKGRTIIKRSAVRSSHSGSLTVLHTLYASALSCCEKKMSSATCLISINLCWDTVVKHLLDCAYWISMLAEKRLS